MASGISSWFLALALVVVAVVAIGSALLRRWQRRRVAEHLGIDWDVLIDLTEPAHPHPKVGGPHRPA